MAAIGIDGYHPTQIGFYKQYREGVSGWQGGTYPGDDGGSSGNGGGGSGGSSGGSGSDAKSKAKERKEMLAAYKQYYLIELKIKPNMRVINAALNGAGFGQGPIGMSMFAKFVALRDPNYRKTDQYTESAQMFTKNFQEMFGGRMPSKRLINRAARRGVGKMTFYRDIAKMSAFRRANPFYEMSGKNLFDYMSLKNSMDSAYQRYLGRGPDRDDYRNRFAADVTGEEFERNMAQYVGSMGALDWSMGGQLDPRQRNALLFNGDFQASVRNKLATAVAAKQGYFSTPGARTDVQRDQLGRVTQNI